MIQFPRACFDAFVFVMKLRLNHLRVQYLVLLLLLAASPLEAAASVWVSSPKPKFPAAALSKGTEGYVVLRTQIGQDGRVIGATIARSSGDPTLDDAARTAVLKWKMNPAAIKPEYRTKGYSLRFDFQQEVPIAARYRDRSAYFDDFESVKVWTHAPFPEYPFHERLVRTEGVVLVRMGIGADGRVVSVEIVKSSGNTNLDNAAVSAVSKWRARLKWAGWRLVMPIRFKMG